MNPVLSHNNKAVLVAIILAFSFALMGVWIRMMGDSFATFQQVYLRILIAGILAFIFFKKKRSAQLFRNINRHEWTVYSIRAFAGYTIGVAAFTVAIQNTDLGVVSFVSSIPILGVLAWMMFREKIPRASLPFVLLSVVGLLFVTRFNIHNVHFGVGEVASIIGMLGFDIGYLMSRMHNKDKNNYENTTILLLIGWIPLFLISIIHHEHIIPQSITLVAILGLILSSVQNVVGLYATNYVFTNLKGYVAGNILLLEGLFALTIGYFLYDEKVTWALAIGGLIITACALAINQVERKRSNANELE